MKLQLFQAAVILHPEETDEKTEEKSKLLIQPHPRMERSSDLLSKLLIREIPDEYVDDFDRIEILIRPF